MADDNETIEDLCSYPGCEAEPRIWIDSRPYCPEHGVKATPTSTEPPGDAERTEQEIERDGFTEEDYRYPLENEGHAPDKNLFCLDMVVAAIRHAQRTGVTDLSIAHAVAEEFSDTSEAKKATADALRREGWLGAVEAFRDCGPSALDEEAIALSYLVESKAPGEGE